MPILPALRLLTYDPATGKIVRRELAAQADAASYPNRFIVGSQVPAAVWDQQPEITMRVDAGVLVDKTPLTITVNTPNVSVGSETVIIVGGLNDPRLIRVGTMVASVSPSDNEVVFSSDIPGTFRVRFMADSLYYSNDTPTIVVS